MSSRNCSPERHKANKSYAQKIGIEHYILFDGEYNSLENKDISKFVESLLNI
jgi:hypothetical protein